MKRNVPLILSFIVLFFIVQACSTSNTGKNCAVWAGEYSYKEDPVPTATGINRIMEWELSVSQQRDTCWGLLEITGLTTYVKLLTTLSGDSSKVDVIYNKYLDGAEDFRPGDILFSLRRDSNNVITCWNTLQPKLTDFPAEEGLCFKAKRQMLNAKR
jgi:hypothetical protein